MHKIILFDIDHTLFNTEAYRKKLYKNLASKLGLSNEKYYEMVHNTYIKIKNNFGHFIPEEFLNSLLKISKKTIDLDTLKSVFHDDTLYSKSLFPDVKNALQELENMNIQIGIFSTGQHSFQQTKIRTLTKYLQENHIYITSNKLNIIKDTFGKYKNYKVYLVDDFPQVLIDTKFHHKNIFTVFMKRKESYPGTIIPKNFKPDAIITDLKQLIDIIKAGN